MLRLATNRLSQGTQGPDAVQVHRALAALGKSVASGEVAKRVYGPSSVEAIRALQEELRVPVTGIVDEATVRVINARLQKRGADERVVRGSVRLSTGAAPVGRSLVARVWLKTLQEKLLGESIVSGDGTFEVRYELGVLAGKRTNVDLRVEIAQLGIATPLQTSPDAATVFQDADFLEVVNFVIVQADQQPQSEYEQIEAGLKETLESLEQIDRFDAGQLQLLADEASFPVEYLGAFVSARRLAGEAKIPTQVFYALIRGGLPANLDSLFATSQDSRVATVERAVQERVVPKNLEDGRLTLEHLKQLSARAVSLASIPPRPGTSSLRDLTKEVLTDAEADDLLGRYVGTGGDAEAFWSGVATHPKAVEFRNVIDLGGLTNNHLPLVRAIRDQRIGDVSELANLSLQEWDQLVSTAGTPPDTPGSSDAEKSANYRKAILDRVESAFLRPFFATRIEEAGAPPQVVRFLRDQREFDPKKTHLDRFLSTHPAASLSDPDKQELKAYQGVLKLAGNVQDAIALRKVVTSAHQVSAMGPRALLEKLPDVDEAAVLKIVQKAEQTNAAALALWSENASALNRTNLAALPSLDSEALHKVAVGTEQEPGLIPDWENLFGSFDLCSCEECNSAHGPAAYFVDLLQFLKGREALDKLTIRRPDLAEIELSCENSNTVLPYVDLVNEILEDRVAPPAPFAPHSLSGVTAADFQGPFATQALLTAFSPSLSRPVSVETLEKGVSWRVLDESFAYQVVQDTGAFKAVTRSKQTTGSTEHRRATPQYRNFGAYEALNAAFYPWTLPFDLSSQEAQVFLAHMNITRADLIEQLRPSTNVLDPSSPVGIRVAMERLGITEQEKLVLVGDLATNRSEYWGTASSDTVQDVLDGSRLTFKELQKAVSTWFVNPGGVLSIDSPESCDTKLLTISGLDDEALSRLHLFVRLWKKLAWTIEEVDAALRALSPTGAAPALTVEILVRLAQLLELQKVLSLPVSELLTFWGSIGTLGEESLYARLFQADKFPKSDREHFRLLPDGLELSNAGQPLTAHAAMLQTVFRVSTSAFAHLVSLTDGNLNLANLSLIFRNSRLSQALHLSPAELVVAIALTGIDPFGSPQESLEFSTAAVEMQGSGFSWSELDYVLRHRFQPSARFVPTDEALSATLTDLHTGLMQVDPTASLNDHHSLVVDRISSALSTPEGLTRSMLGPVEMNTLLALKQMPEGQAIIRLDAGAQFELLQKMHKIAFVVEELKFPGDQWRLMSGPDAWVNLNQLPANTVDTSPLELVQWIQLVRVGRLGRELSMEAGGADAILSAQDAVAMAVGDSEQRQAKAVYVATLVQWLGWNSADVQVLVGKDDDVADLGIIQARLPEDYRSFGLLARLAKANRTLKILGVSAEQASGWCEDALSAGEARAVRAAAMARHSEESWLRVARPLQDALRNRQRSALVDYLVARPETWLPPGPAERLDANELFSHLLVDVEMDACQLSSRIKQATGSVQLFAQRCLIGLEDVAVDDDKWLQWSWMKNFRVWEANRKVWLYPENWIEPELRDNKTPFFKDLETELLQGEITDSAAEKALVHYLEKLDQVGRLEICGVYEDDQAQKLHVFGRTFNAPNLYFYRCARIIDGSPKRYVGWTPWERVELDIDGDHLIPVVRNGKLMLIWPVFNEKQESRPVRMPEPGGVLQSGDGYWDIQMAWSEYQGGEWPAKNLSASVSLKAYQGIDDVVFGKIVPPADKAGIGHLIFRCNDPNNEGCPPPEPYEEEEDPRPPTTGSGGSGGGAPPPAKSPVLVGKNLFSFKAFAVGDSVVVRGYLSLGYAASPDPGVAAAFGEFRLTGCRSIVTPRPRSSIQVKTLPLAPKGTRFNSMWFDGGGGLSLMDGELPFHRDIMGGIVDRGNVPAPLFDGLPTVASMKANRIDIDVLSSTPSAYRLLAPHQDLHFKANRPFFFMDHERTLMVTSTGSSGQSVRPDLSEWTVGDLAGVWTANYFGARTVTPPSAPASEDRALLVLKRGSDGRRVSKRIVPLDLNPQIELNRGISTFWTTRRYYFAPFQQPFTCEFLTKLDSAQLRGLFSLETQEQSREFFDSYSPAPARVQIGPGPMDEIDFRHDGPYEAYNWELFFHIPLLVADRLTKNQRFEEALRWYHFIFDPTGSSSGEAPQRYWKTLPFHRRLQHGEGNDSYEAQNVINIERALTDGLSTDWLAAVQEWRAKPFNPHALARLRTTAYQKNVVMKYIDNLIAWGDQLFRRETLETLNEATQLYVLAAEILGSRPEVVDRQTAHRVQTFRSLSEGGGVRPLSNVEQLVPEVGGGTGPESVETPELPNESVLYFCVPENKTLLGYWDKVADRLFKLRHCMDIEGRVRQLPLFPPPIDPALLVRAQAAGLSISDVLDDAAGIPSHFRFSVTLQTANELTAEARNLGAALLSALEKHDAEAMARLRSGQERAILTAGRDSRQKSVSEAKEQVAASRESLRAAERRKQFYESREFQNAQETMSLELSSRAYGLSEKSAGLRYLAGKLAAVGALKLGSPTTSGLEIGPDYIARSLEAEAGAFDARANRKNVESLKASRLGDFTRRMDEWKLQADLSELDIKQLERQLTASEIRLAIAERELVNHDLLIENAREADQFMREKFTSVDLYSWMVGQTSALYFQTYELAYDAARRAERCLQHELGEREAATTYIRFGYWDSLKKGLMAGDQLAHDLRRLELAHQEKSKREFELTKHVSLATLDPFAFIALKETGRCDEVKIPEFLFDLETPGHFQRRLKAVSVTIPCVTGPYTGVHCTLRLLGNEIRWDPTAPTGADTYPRASTDDPRFIVDRRTLGAIVTSAAQNDYGMFDANLRDERYLPFEGAGAVSTWSLELPTDFRSFDYGTISDVIIHLRYTAQDGGEALKAKAVEATNALLSAGLVAGGVNGSAARPLARVVSLRHEFPSEWHRFLSSPESIEYSVVVDVARNRFPYLFQNREITVKKATVAVRAKVSDPVQVGISPGQTSPVAFSNPWEGQSQPGLWTITTTMSPKNFEDIFVIVEFSAG